MSTTAKDAIAAIVTRLQAILISGGYNTNAGEQVYNGIRYFNDDSTFPLITIFTGDEIVEDITLAPKTYRAERSVNIEAYVQDATTSTISLEDLIADIQQAIELTDETLGGIVEVLDYTGIDDIDQMEAGSDIAGVRITYLFQYRRTYGA